MLRGLFRYDVTACETKVSVLTMLWCVLLATFPFIYVIKLLL